MPDIQAITLSGAETVVPAADVEGLQARVRGRVLTAGDDGYDAARQVYNGMIQRRPALIVQCAGPADVMQAVSFARDHGVLLCVRGGGHNVAGLAVADGAVMVDLSQMRAVRVDPGAARARAEGGATWREYDHETQAFGLASTGGFFPSTGIAGLTLGGGVGWLMGKCGLSIDNLTSADVVTADGTLVKASADENPDLFWGLRGGGGNFGVVTSFEFRLHAVGPLITGGLRVYPFDRAGDVLRFFRDFTANAPDEVRALGVLVSTPDGSPAAAIALCHCGTREQAQRDLAALDRLGTPVMDALQAMPYVAMQGLLEAGFPWGQQNYWKSSFLRELPDAAIDTLIDEFRQVPTPNSALVLEQVGGAAGRVPREDMAFEHRDMPFNFLALGAGPDPASAPAMTRWAQSAWSAMQPYAPEAVYVNYLGTADDEGQDRIRAAYGPQKYQRLAELKRKYDPGNLFRCNQNIRPAG